MNWVSCAVVELVTTSPRLIQISTDTHMHTHQTSKGRATLIPAGTGRLYRGDTTLAQKINMTPFALACFVGEFRRPKDTEASQYSVHHAALSAFIISIVTTTLEFSIT